MKLSSRKRSRSRGIELAMTSMIDVVFLLLIFFMVTSSFIATERELDSAIRTKAPASQRRDDFVPAVIEVTPRDGGIAYVLAGRSFNDAAELEEVLRQFPDKTDGAHVHVADEAPFADAAAAIQAAKSAGFGAVSYTPETSSPPTPEVP